MYRALEIDANSTVIFNFYQFFLTQTIAEPKVTVLTLFKTTNDTMKMWSFTVDGLKIKVQQHIT